MSLRERWRALTASRVVREVRKRHLTYLGYDALSDLERAVRRLEAAGVPGIIVEAGCALGGSTVVLGSVKRPDRPLRAYDVFGLIPPPSDADGADIHARYRTVVQGEARGIPCDPSAWTRRRAASSWFRDCSRIRFGWTGRSRWRTSTPTGTSR
jgi:asparagine synthase (glutamine-hydrolysing)